MIRSDEMLDGSDGTSGLLGLYVWVCPLGPGPPPLKDRLQYADYLSFLTTALYRRWGAAFARANARVRITRLRLVGSRGRRADAVGDGEWDGLGGAGVFAEGNRPL